MNSINWPASIVWVFIAQLVEYRSAKAEARENLFAATAMATYSYRSSCSVIVRVSVVLKRTVGDSD